MVYYAAPPSVLAATALAAGLGWFMRGRRKLALVAAGMGIAWGVWWSQAAWVNNAPATVPSDARVAFWNIARGSRGWIPVSQRIGDSDADIIGLVEAGQDVTRMIAWWQGRLPEYHCAVCPSGITLLARRPITHVAGDTLAGDYGWYEHYRVETGDGPLNVVLVDIKSNPLRGRRQPLAALTRILEPLADQPVVVMGDFNTPTDSVHLRPLRETYRNAFETAGQGYAPTWPLPLPVLTIDQMWANDGVQVRRCELVSTWASDHRLIQADISLAPTPRAP